MRFRFEVTAVGVPVVTSSLTVTFGRTILDSVRAGWLRQYVAGIVVPEMILAFASSFCFAVLNAIRAGFRFRLRVAGIVVPEVALSFAGSSGCTVLDAIGTGQRFRLQVTSIVVPEVILTFTVCLGSTVLNAIGTG